MARLLVTSPSNDSRGIYTVDTATEKYTVKHEDLFPMGIARYTEGYVVTDRHDGVFLMDEELNIVKHFPYMGKELHDVVVVDRLLYIVESYANRINVFTLDGQFVTDVRLCKETYDRMHLNSLKLHNGKFYLSMFSLAPMKEFKLEGDGGIIRLDAETLEVEDILVNGLTHPHSICFVDGELHYADSIRACIFKGDKELVTHALSYTRGLAYDDNYLYIGESRDRHAGTHDLDIPASLRGAVLMVNRSTGEHQRIELPAHEIYEVFLVR